MSRNLENPLRRRKPFPPPHTHPIAISFANISLCPIMLLYTWAEHYQVGELRTYTAHYKVNVHQYLRTSQQYLSLGRNDNNSHLSI